MYDGQSKRSLVTVMGDCMNLPKKKDEKLK